jgi:transposase InsO family protein
VHSVFRVLTVILHHLNRMNREDGLVLSRSWKPFIQTLREKRKTFHENIQP